MAAKPKAEPGGEPVPAPDQVELELFQWCRSVTSRIVFGELRSGRKFCRVTVARNIAAERPTFREAAEHCRALLERAQERRGQHLRLQG